MTEYGRGPGSEPWPPEDPSYGDQGWGDQQAAHGQGQYDGQQQSYPQDPYAHSQQGYPQAQQDPYAQQQSQQAQQDPYAQQQGQQDPYAQQQHQQHQQDPYAQQHQQHQQDQQDPYAHQQQQYGAPQDPYAQQPPQQPQYNGGWDTGQQAAMPYDPQTPAPYASNEQGGYGEQADHYGTPEAYPPPQPPGHRERTPEPQQQTPDWDPDAPQEETHPFFTGADEPADRDDRAPRDDDGDDDDPPARRGGGDRRGKEKKKSRNGCACLVLSVVLVGGLGGGGYLGYSYYQDQFGPAEDYAGDGTGSVEVEIPKGALGNEIANILKRKGVVKSADAFVSAQNGNPKGKSIQAGVYLLKKEMSANSAIELMLDPKSQNGFVVAPGWRNVKVYEAIDKRLELKAGTTKKVAETQSGSFGLPDWADDGPVIKDPLEGFLYPATYPVAKGAKPEAVLKKMVDRANAEYGVFDLEKAAKDHNLDSPWQVITVASLVQAEGLTHDDFRKMAEVVYNRLKPDNTVTNRKLQFDSAFNYLKGQSEIKITSKEIMTNDDPYNTYYHAGLTPGPIGNPGADALRATLNPTSDGWMFFISLDGKKTDFTKTAAEHEKLNDKFKEQHGLD